MQKIEVIKCLLSDVSQQGKRPYKVAEVMYKATNGATKGLKVLSFAQPDIYKTLETVQSGDFLDVDFMQNDKGYWQFSSVAKGEKPAQPQEAPVSRGNWETAEERAAKQRYIVRQSSLSNAIAYHGAADTPSVDQVIDTARVFESYVFGDVE